MIGIGQADAREAVERGWRRDTLLRLHQLMLARGSVVTVRTPWAFFVDSRYLIYSSFSPQDVELALSSTGTWLTGAEAYTDGSGTTFDKPAGIGVVVYRPEEAPELIAENVGPGTNNRAELLAIWRALRAMPDVCRPLLISSDSEYAIGSCTKDWNPNANASLIHAMRYDLMLRSTMRAVDFRHVPGHRDIEGNEIADKLANIGRKIISTTTLYQEA